MNRTLHTLLLALFLTAIALSIFLHKLTASATPLLPNQTFNSWYVEAKISLASEQLGLESEETLPTSLEFYLPQDSLRYQIAEEDFVDEGFDRQLEELDDSSNRLAILTREGNDSSNLLFYRAVIRRQESVLPGTEDIPLSGRRLVDKQLMQFGENTERVQDNLAENPPTAEVNSLLNEARSQSGNAPEGPLRDRLSLAQRVYQLALNTNDIRVQSIRRNLRVEESTPAFAAFILGQAGVPVRVGNGILLRRDEDYSTEFIQWLEVQDGDRWLAFDPISNSFGAQDRYLTWWYGTDRVIQAEGARNIGLEIVVQPNADDGLTQSILQGERVKNPFLEYSFLKLPLATQRVFQVLVLIPIGALVISILHQILGLKTFGTFTPILIAIAFRQTGLLVGIPLFAFVVIIGLLMRGYLDRLQLLIVPRLAAILTATVLLVGLLAVLMQSFNINLGLSVSLFPIVILAMTIERAALMWEENGSADTIIAGLGTIIAAAIGYVCMINDYVQYWAFVFPELLLIVLGLNLLVGRYNGYKLIEYFRFRSLQRQLNQTQG